MTARVPRGSRQRQKEQLAAERKQAAEHERAKRRAVRSERVARVAAATALRSLAVAVRNEQVFRADFGVVTGREEGRPLGGLAGAHAEVTGGRARHRRSGHGRTADTVAATALLGPVDLLATASRKGTKGPRLSSSPTARSMKNMSATVKGHSRPAMAAAGLSDRWGSNDDANGIRFGDGGYKRPARISPRLAICSAVP